jgi:hypothetical protein
MPWNYNTQNSDISHRLVNLKNNGMEIFTAIIAINSQLWIYMIKHKHQTVFFEVLLEGMKLDIAPIRTEWLSNCQEKCLYYVALHQVNDIHTFPVTHSCRCSSSSGMLCHSLNKATNICKNKRKINKTCKTIKA